MMDSTGYRGNEHEDDSGIESSAADSGDNAIYIRVCMPETKVQRCLQFHPSNTVWTAKQQVLVTLGKDLKDGLNYGLYCPPTNGKAGKFLDEERLLKDYPLPGPIGYLEFKYKRRVYKLMQVNQRKLKQLNCKANLKQFMEFVRKGDIEKMTKMLKRGLDPNFQDHETGDIPLTLSASSTKCCNVIITLVGGGAHLDFRSRSGMTAMHRAAMCGNCNAIKILLELGASPDYKDSHGLTPLYHAVAHNTDPKCIEMLLYDHAALGTADDHSWSEVHQACKSACVQNLEHLLFYGADMNVQNSSGNTPLHVAALNAQESCVRVLLFRGADRTVLNYSNQDAFDVAIISSNTELAHIIKNFRQEDVVPFQEMPTYNDKRRASSSAQNMLRCRSVQSLNLLYSGGNKSSSSASLSLAAHQYSSSGNLFESEMMGGSRYDSDSPRSMSISSGAGSSSVLNVSDHGYRTVGNVDHRTAQPHVHQVYVHNNGGASSLHDGDIGSGPSETIGDGDGIPHTVVLQRTMNGYGFVLRGAKSQTHDSESLLKFSPTPELPALQYLDRVDKGSVADRAGLKPADFILEINGENVISATHERTVQLIKNSTDRLVMTVVTARALGNASYDMHMDGTRTLPVMKRGAPIVNTTSSADVHRMNAIAHGIDPNNKTASIRSRHNKRMTSVPLDEIFTQSIDIDYTDAPSHAQHADVHARDHMERAASTPNLLVGSRTHVTTVKVGDEDIASDDRVSYRNTACSGERIYAQPFRGPGHGVPGHTAPDNGSYRGNNLHVQIRNTDRSTIPQPPSHCPPPPPIRTTRDIESTIVRQPHIYSNLSQEPSLPVNEDRISLFESSFRPGSNARLSKVPADVPMAVASGSGGGYSRTYSSPAGQGRQDVKEPVPDYDGRDNERGRVVRQQTEPINSLRESHRMTTTPYAAATTEPPVMRNDIAAAIKFAADSRSKQAQQQQQVTQTKPVPPPPSHAPPPPPSSHVSPPPPPLPSHIPPPPPPPSHAPPTPPRSLHAPSRTPTPPSQKPPQSSQIPPPPPPPPQSNTPTPPPSIRSGDFDIDEIRNPPSLRHVPKDVPREPPRETTPQDQSRAALLAAVAKRRNVVDNSDMEGLADSIENRIHRSKKLLTTVYKSDQTKQQLSSPESPGKMAPLSFPDQAKKPDGGNVWESEATLSRASLAQQRATPNRTGVIPGDTASDDNFKSIAEKKRQEWLQRKTGGTSNATGSSPGDGEEVESKEDEERVKPRRTAPMPPSKHLKPSLGGTPDPAPNLGGMAQVIAQKAQQFQQSNNNKSPERNNNSTNDRNAMNGSNGHTVTGMNTARGGPIGSRAIYASQNSQREVVTQNGLKTKAFASSQRERDCPPPLVAGRHAMGLSHVTGPATGMKPDSRQAWRNGDSDSTTTVGWLVNPSPLHETALREKLSQRRDIAPREVAVDDDDRFSNVSQLVMMHEHQYVPQMVDISPLVDVAFIPPPLSFENEPHNGLPMHVIPDDSVSTVSSLSTLSTLSSTDHDTHDVMHFRQAPAVIAEVECELLAPPPPGFGDSPMGSTDDLRGDFIPPPMDFGETAPASLPSVTSLRNVLKPSVSSPHFIDVSFRDKPVQNWTVSDVCDWLDSVHMGGHKQAFMRDQVNGEQLLCISRARLISLGVAQLADQAIFDHVIKGVTF